MSRLPAILIVGGYVALIWTGGWWGVGLAAVHVGVMGFAASRRRRDPRKR